jgi:signal transduction histidine kinase
MIRAILPKSLAGQLMLVTALALMAAQAVNLTLLVRAQRAETLASIAAGGASQIADASDRLANGLPVPQANDRRRSPQDRTETGDRNNAERAGGRGRRTVIGPEPRFRPGMTERPDLAVRVARFLADADVEVTAVRAAAMTGTSRYDPVAKRERAFTLVAVAAQLPDGRWITARARLPVPQRRLGGALIVQTLILFALLLGPLLFVAWRVSRPLASLARAAGNFRPGQDAEALVESGPEDVRALTRAFTAMRQRILSMLTEKDRMLGAVGHDLRTPLASLRVRVESIDDEALRSKLVATIEEMATTLDDILSLARAGQPREAPEPTDLAALLADVVADYQAMQRPVSLAVEGALVTRTVRGASLRRAVRNLIDNAVAYGGSATVGLSEDKDGEVIISIDDSGPGIPEAQIADLMEPFARAERSRNRDTGGSGLGLALAKAIALAEGGKVELVNRRQGGLSARIILPQISDQT